jgi:hypothetical protein
VEKYGIARKATDYNMVHVYCMLDTYSYKHALRICNTDCFFPASVVAQMCLNVISLKYATMFIIHTCGKV